MVRVAFSIGAHIRIEWDLFGALITVSGIYQVLGLGKSVICYVLYFGDSGISQVIGLGENGIDRCCG